MTTHEEYVTYEQAKALKELDFDWQCKYHLEKDKLGKTYMIVLCDECLCNSELKSDELALPTQAATCRWLREEKNLFIDVWLCAAGWSWNIEKCGSLECNGTHVTKHDEESGDDEDSGLFTTYEKALSDGINHAIKLLINNKSTL